MQPAEVADFQPAIGQAVREEPADQLHGVEVESSWACTAGFAVGERDGTGVESHKAAVGEGHFADIRGEGGERRVAVGVGLTVAVPGDSPDLGVDLL